MIAALVSSALPLLLAATADAAPLAPTVHLEADTVRADENGTWVIPITFHNPGPMGLYGDSMYVDVTDLDPGVSRAPRRSTVSMGFWIKRGGAVGGGEDKTLPFSLQATCERAKLALRMYVHDGGHVAYTFRESLLAGPGALAASMPSAFLELKGKRIEIMTAATAVTGPVPHTARRLRSVPGSAASFASAASSAASVAGPAMSAGPSESP